MRILIANDEVSQVLSSPLPARLAKYGSIDIVKNGRAAVLAYVNTGSSGAFYDLIVVDQHLTALDGFAVAKQIRMHESKLRSSEKRSMVCIISSDDSCHQHRCDQDERTCILRKPASLDLLESLASSVAAKGEVQRAGHFVPMAMGQPTSPEVWATAQ